MSARVSFTKPIGPQTGEIMARLLDDSLARLTARTTDIGSDVHEVRKNLKAFRSYLRLLRPIVGDDAYRRLNLRARDAARILSGVRDTAALHDAIGQVGEYGRRSRTPFDVQALRKAANAEMRQSADPAAFGAMAKDVAAHLSECGKEIRAWQLPGEPKPYLKGLTRSYATARRRLADGLGSRRPEKMHEARKRIIHWRYQLDLFAGLWPRPLKAEVRELQDLRELLGQYNDLVMLERRLAAADGAFAEIAEPVVFLDAITVLRADRAHAARFRGELLFVDTPSQRANRLDRWSQAAHIYAERLAT